MGLNFVGKLWKGAQLRPGEYLKGGFAPRTRCHHRPRVPLGQREPRHADLPPAPGQRLDPMAPSPKVLFFPPVIRGATAAPYGEAIAYMLLLSEATRGRKG